MEKLLKKVMDQVEFDKNFQIKLPSGYVYQKREGEPVFKMHIKTRNALDAVLTQMAMGFGENYMAEDIEFEGDLEHVCHLGFELADNNHLNISFTEKVKFLIGFLIRRNTLTGSRKNIAHHYDLGNDFYSLWLDKQAMQYTCAYFHEKTDSIETAQIQKLDHVCRKVLLKPGESVVEAGCGWGGFALYAVQNFGVSVRAYNISQEQIEYAREKAKRLKIPESRLEYVHDDYRNIPGSKKIYDHFVSVGMLEHVGKENYSSLFKIIRETTKPKSLSLVHTIGKTFPLFTEPFLEKHIFPGSYMPSLGEIMNPLEKLRIPLHVVDVENLRYHYALTIDHWWNRFEEHADTIKKMYGESFLRMFRLYLRGSSAAFRYGGVLLFQILLSNGNNDNNPLTREHLYNVKNKVYTNGNGKKTNGLHKKIKIGKK
ncbi:MAG: cyclopropane-fatty-acyl-phospholipid synthase family protein [Leptospira sp.]|nr:cyclopropane-fatty-acyl-phospholipid synthase family protein [Leptospira sp.]